MFDELIFIFNQYAIWVVLLLGVFKLYHIISYRGLVPAYIVTTFFTIFSGVQLSDARNYEERFRFRRMHNLLTLTFYGLLLCWGIIRIILLQIHK